LLLMQELAMHVIPASAWHALQAARSIEDFSAQSLCNLLYGLAVLQQPPGDDLAAALPSAVADRCVRWLEAQPGGTSTAASIAACVSKAMFLLQAGGLHAAGTGNVYLGADRTAGAWQTALSCAMLVCVF
jgi:hypothetical protein